MIINAWPATFRSHTDRKFEADGPGGIFARFLYRDLRTYGCDAITARHAVIGNLFSSGRIKETDR